MSIIFAKESAIGELIVTSDKTIDRFGRNDARNRVLIRRSCSGSIQLSKIQSFQQYGSLVYFAGANPTRLFATSKAA
jgi:hypothetical protein